MSLTLSEKPQKIVLLNGFPGFGLVGTITTEFLIEHLDTKPIGRILLEEQPALLAIHDGKVVEPIGIFYSRKYNLGIVHAINSSTGTEWKISEILIDVAKQLNVREIICIEGVGSPEEIGSEKVLTFYFTNNRNNEKVLKSLGVKPLREGIIMGVTSALLLKANDLNITCLFAETHTHLPDSKAAAKIIEILNSYLNLGVDVAPLIESAQKFEDKLRMLLKQSKTSEAKREKRELTYVG